MNGLVFVRQGDLDAILFLTLANADTTASRAGIDRHRRLDADGGPERKDLRGREGVRE